MARIAVDAMGGDFAPAPIVAGAIKAASGGSGIQVLYLVGNERAIQDELATYASVPSCIEIVHASEVVLMNEAPATAVRRKKDSSIGRCADLVKEGRADALYSAGNTGATMAAATLKLRTLDGVTRPAISALFPTQGHPTVLVDAGANTDSTAQMLCQFGIMGSVYSREILHVDEPRVGLISIGEEDDKGNETTKEAFRLLERSSVNFVGNAEGADLFENNVDVAVCDGFVGNVMLKTSESVARFLEGWVREELRSRLLYRIGAFLCRGAFGRIKEKSDPAYYGGAPLLGVNGVCIIGHGSSTATAAANAIRVAVESVDHKINPQIIEQIKELTVPHA